MIHQIGVGKIHDLRTVDTRQTTFLFYVCILFCCYFLHDGSIPSWVCVWWLLVNHTVAVCSKKTDTGVITFAGARL